MDYIFFREHEPLPEKKSSPRWYAIRRALRFKERFDNVTFVTSSFDHYRKEIKYIPNWLKDEGIKIVFTPALKYSHNKSPIRLVNTFIFNAFSYFYLLKIKTSFVFFSAPTLGVFCFPIFPILRHRIYGELRDCWPLIAKTKTKKIFPNFRYFILKSFAIFSYRRFTNFFRLRAVSKGVYEYLERSIVDKGNLIYRPFVCENINFIGNTKIDSRAVFIGTFETGFDVEEFKRILSDSFTKKLNIKVAGYGIKQEIVKEICEGISNVDFIGKVSHNEAHELMIKAEYLLTFYPKEVGFENHRTNKIMEAEIFNLKIISNIPLDTRARLIIV